MAVTAPAFCPRVAGSRLARGVPPAYEHENVRYVQRRAWGYPGRRWLRGRALLLGELERAGVLVETTSLGCGSFGCAYPVEGRRDLVVKITGDFTEAAAAQASIVARARGHVFPALVAYHCVYGVRGAPMFALLMERLLPLSREERAYIYAAQGMGSAEAPALFDEVTEHGNQAAEGTLLHMAEARLGGHGRAQAKALLDTIQRLARVGIRWHDLHTGNVLRDARGDWKIIDLGVSVVPAQRVPRLGEAFHGLFDR